MRWLGQTVRVSAQRYIHNERDQIIVDPLYGLCGSGVLPANGLWFCSILGR